MAASAVAVSSRALDPHHGPALYVSAEDSSSSSSSTLRAAESELVACEGGGEEGELDLDSPWVAAAEAELRLDAVALEALSLCVDRQLEEDEIRDNQQRQEDELMALEAIYGNDLDMFEKKGGLRCFQIYIHCDVVDGVELRVKLTSSNACDKDAGYSDGRGHDDRSEEFSYTCNFGFLPPLILTCLLPLSYPSKDPPYFIVTAKWMDGPYLSQLCEMLDTIWTELPEQEVVYQWVEWLRNSSMSYLWFDGNMTLSPDIVTRNGDNRTISRTSSLESIIPLMLSYSSKKHYQVFLDDIHMCMICLNQGKVIDPLLSKHHVIKLNLISKILMHVKEGSVFKLICPDTKCNASIPAYMLKRLLSKEEFERWDRLVLQKALDSMSDAPCHPGKQCITPEDKIQHQQETGKITGKEMAQELLSIKEAYKDVRLCPKCRMAIAKTEGCNKVVCGNCGQYFCFRCGKAIDGYEHFG
ncbi:hypothetical protein PR202_gb14502 [Eleusine coracana subsp. coracana]|uniref:RBR-type E3 ubiquitin transferase n=1 Tax=Eleusine coracana subsp. coracana TaxID=191504 RepID=A0AAV5EVD5_ELECO|nr:hypothetical protein PR202_gb14502 [Eleusine coracana subsp. coracana]